MRTQISDGRSIDYFIPPQLRGMFYRNPYEKAKYARRDGVDPYSLSTNGLVLYLPLWALKNSTVESVDAHKYPFTATGALWSPDGRVMDGDDFLKYAAPASWRLSDTIGSIIIWFKTSGDCALFTTADEGDATTYFKFGVRSTNQLRFDLLDAGAGNDGIYGDTNVKDGNWHMGAVTADGSTWVLYTDDGNVEGLTVGAGSNTGEWFDQVVNRDNVVIGARIRNTTDDYLTGTLGEVTVWSRTLTQAEIKHYFRITKWRYQ